MKRKQRTFAIILAMALVIGTLSGCSSQKSASSMDNTGMSATGGEYYEENTASTATAEEGVMDGAMSPQTAPATGEGNAFSYNPNRKLIRTVDLCLQTKTFDQLQTNLTAKINQVGAYIENSNIVGNGYGSTGSRRLTMTVRVPKDKLDLFISDVSGLGNVTEKNEQVQDVTLQYVDIESRKKSLSIQQERLLEMLKKATKLEDMITLETRLSEVRYEIESIERQLRTYDSQVDYSTVNLQVYEVERITEKPAETLWERMSSGFSETLRDMGDGLASFAVWVVASLPYLVIWAGVIWVLVIVIKKIVKKQRNKTPKAIPNSSEPMVPTMEEEQNETKE